MRPIARTLLLGPPRTTVSHAPAVTGLGGTGSGAAVARMGNRHHEGTDAGMAPDRHVIVDDSTLLTFSGLDHNVYNAVLRNLATFVDLRVTDLARLAGVSNATVVRFCKKCGYTGFPEFKRAVLTRLRQERPTGPVPPVLEEVLAVTAPESLEALSGQIARAFELVRWADCMLLLGSGKSGGLASYGAHLFSGLGVASIPITSFPTYATSMGTSDTTLLVLSHSGSTPMVYTAMQHLVAGQSKAVAVTANPQSPIGRLANVCVSYPTQTGLSLSTGDLSTRFCMLYVLEQLARMLYNDGIAGDGAPMGDRSAP